MYSKWWILKAASGEIVRGWPVTVARQLNTAPLVTRLYPLDLTLLVSTCSCCVLPVDFGIVRVDPFHFLV